jgi:hypothetical protein
VEITTADEDDNSNADDDRHVFDVVLRLTLEKPWER